MYLSVPLLCMRLQHCCGIDISLSDWFRSRSSLFAIIGIVIAFFLLLFHIQTHIHTHAYTLPLTHTSFAHSKIANRTESIRRVKNVRVCTLCVAWHPSNRKRMGFYFAVAFALPLEIAHIFSVAHADSNDCISPILSIFVVSMF